MSDEIVDKKRCKEIVKERFAESDLRGGAWFHPVKDGHKGSVVDHSDPENLSTDIPAGNYGVCASLPDTLVLIDIDDHKDGYDEDALAYAREQLPDTLTFDSAHGGEGRPYHVPVDDEGRMVAKRLKDEFGKANVSAVTWGEIRAANQYIVGAGSQLNADGCTKDDCSRCAEPDGGRYTIKHDRAIATLDADLLVEILDADPGTEKDGGDSGDDGDLSEFDTAGGVQNGTDSNLHTTVDDGTPDTAGASPVGAVDDQQRYAWGEVSLRATHNDGAAETAIVVEESDAAAVRELADALDTLAEHLEGTDD